MRRTIPAPLASTLIATVLATTPQAALAGGPTNINVSMRGGNQTEAASAVDPSDSDNVVIASNVEHSAGLFVGVSHDGGATWSRRILGDGDRFGQACCDATLSWDDSGNLFLVWLDLEDFSAIPVALSTDAGDHWSILAELHPKPPGQAVRSAAFPIRGGGGGEGDGDGDGRPKSSVDQPTVTSGNGVVWVVWNNRGSMQAAGARIRGVGDVGGFHRRQDVPHTLGCSFGDVAVAPTGRVMQVCTKDRKTTPVRTRIRVNTDPDGLGPKGFGPGHPIGITNVQQFDSIPPQRDRTVDAEVGLAWDRSGGAHTGRVTMIYTDETPNESGNTDVYSRYSDDAGASWSLPVRVSTAGGGAQFLPKIAVDQQGGGQLAAAWHDTRLDVGDRSFGDTDGRRNTDAAFFMSFSTDGGQTWLTDFRVSAGVSNAKVADNGIDYGDYVGLSFANGVAWPAWADNSNSTRDNPGGGLGTFDIYTAKILD